MQERKIFIISQKIPEITIFKEFNTMSVNLKAGICNGYAFL
jgi:hypothetical protein